MTLLLLLVSAVPALAQNPDYSASIATNQATVYQNGDPAPTITVTITNLQQQKSKDINTVVLTLPSGFINTTGVSISRGGWSSSISANGLTISATSSGVQSDIDGGTDPHTSMTISFQSKPTGSGTQDIGVVCTHRNGVDISTIPVSVSLYVAPCTGVTTVTTQPVSQTVCSGSSVNFYSVVNGTSGTTSMIWQRSIDGGSTWTDITGETSSPLALGVVNGSMNGYRYRATFASICGSETVTSDEAILTVLSPATVSDPINQTVTSGQSAVFTVTPSSGSTLIWEQSTNSGGSWTTMAGEVGSTLTLDPVTTSMSGRLYRATASATCGSETSLAASLTVNPIATSTSVSDAAADYGDASVTLDAMVTPSAAPGTVTFSVDGTPVGSTALVAGNGSISFDPSTLGAGAHEISVSYDGASEYATSIGTATLTISKVPLTITAENKSREYGEANPPLTVAYSGFVNGESPADLGGALDVTTTATATSPIGPWPITLGGYTSDNYTITYIPGTLTITKAMLTITGPTLSREYGDANPSLDGSYSGEKNGETFTVTGSTTATPTSSIGAYAIVPDVSGVTLSNYDVTVVNGSLTVGTATLTIFAPSPTREYGDPNPSLDGGYSGQKNGELFVVTGSTPATQTSPFGTYTVTPHVSGATLSNYVVVPVPGTLTIEKATLTITGPTLGREYGEPNPDLGGTFDGEKNGETFVVTGSTTATETSPFGPYAIVPDVSGATLSNYDVIVVNGTLTIGKATLTITAPTLAREYGDANPSLDGGFSGQKNGETFVVTGSTDATLTSVIGDYAIIPDVTGATIDNYVVIPVNGVLTVEPATLTITAPSPTREYGEPNPDLGGSYGGEKNGESFIVTGSTPATETSNFGTYPVIPDVTGPTLGNYIIVPVNGILTVTRATLTITAPTLFREYGEANPSLDGGFSGAKNGETFVVTGSTAATETSPFGVYPIVPDVSGITIANYDVTPVNGTLTVYKATLTITAPSPTRYQGEPNPSLDGSYEGQKNDEIFVVTGSTTATQSSPVGTYPVIPDVTGLTLPNYDVVVVEGILTVNPVCPTIETAPVAATACEGAPASFTVVAAGTGPFSYQWRHDGNEIPGANEATYEISSVSPSDYGNYDVVVSAYCTPVTSTPVTLTVDLAEITAQPTGITVCAGVPATFAVGVSGECATYQWRRNGVDLVDDGTYSGTTTSMLTVVTSSIDVAGTFDVVVSGTESDAVTLTVNPTIAVTATPSLVAYKPGKMRTIYMSLTPSTTCTSGSFMLESITANEPIATNDIQFATYNTCPADLNFSVASRRNGASPRIYTIRYKGTDAAGNCSYRTTTVTVPLVGGMKPTSPEDETDAVTGVVGASILEQNSPNPFSDATELRFMLPSAGMARVTVYDMNGRLVAELLDEHREAGMHIVRWNGELANGNRAESGNYVYRLETETGVVARTMTISR